MSVKERKEEDKRRINKNRNQITEWGTITSQTEKSMWSFDHIFSLSDFFQLPHRLCPTQKSQASKECIYHTYMYIDIRIQIKDLHLTHKHCIRQCSMRRWLYIINTINRKHESSTNQDLSYCCQELGNIPNEIRINGSKTTKPVFPLQQAIKKLECLLTYLAQLCIHLSLETSALLSILKQKQTSQWSWNMEWKRNIFTCTLTQIFLLMPF